MHKEKCQSIFLQNLAEKAKVKIKYGWNSELWKTSVGSFENVASSELRVDTGLGGIYHYHWEQERI